MPDRCDNTDLPVDQCAHCTGDTLNEVEDPSYVITIIDSSTYGGKCGHCGESFPAGSRIVLDAVSGWWIASHHVGDTDAR